MAVQLKGDPITRNVTADLLGGNTEDTLLGVSPSVALERFVKLQYWGSTIVVFLESDDRVPWGEMKKFIDAASANPVMNIKSVRHGNFIKTHEMVFKELRPNKQRDTDSAPASEGGDLK